MAGSSPKTGKAGDQQVTNADKQNQNQNHGASTSHPVIGNDASKRVNNASVRERTQARAKPVESSSAPTSQDLSSTIPKEEAKADSKKSCTGAVAGDNHQKVAESSTASEPKASGEWGDIYDDVSDDDEEEDDDEDEEDGFDDAARPGQTATQYGWL